MALIVLLTLLGGSLMFNLLRAAEKILLILFSASWYYMTLVLALSASLGIQKLLNGHFLSYFGRNDCYKPALDRGFPFWPLFCASKTTLETDFGLPKSWFCLSRHFLRWRQQEGPITVGDMAGWHHVDLRVRRVVSYLRHTTFLQKAIWEEGALPQPRGWRVVGVRRENRSSPGR